MVRYNVELEGMYSYTDKPAPPNEEALYGSSQSDDLSKCEVLYVSVQKIDECMLTVINWIFACHCTLTACDEIHHNRVPRCQETSCCFEYWDDKSKDSYAFHDASLPNVYRRIWALQWLPGPGTWAWVPTKRFVHHRVSNECDSLVDDDPYLKCLDQCRKYIGSDIVLYHRESWGACR